MLIPDHETDVDYLNCEAISRTVIELLEGHREHPVTVGIHGDWGAGKSSILKLIESGLERDKKVAVLWFNGWIFQDFDDAKTVLIESIITELGQKCSAVGKVKKKSAALLKRVRWMKIAKQGSGVGFNLLTGLPSPDQLETAVTALKDVGKSIADIDPKDIPAKLDLISAYLGPAAEIKGMPETIHQFREDFKDLLNEAKIDQLVVLVDDLDRCLPETAIETLEAIRLFLFVPKTAFVIGADEAMIEYAVRNHFPDLPVASGPLPYARNYLEKLIQIPLRVPALGAQETRTYVTLLLVQSLVGDKHDGFSGLLEKARESLRKPWLNTGLAQSDIQGVDKDLRVELNAAFILAQQIAPMLADGTAGNPRQLKRFLNALLLRQMIAKARGFDNEIKQPVLAKLMLVELFHPDFYDRIASESLSAEDGTSTLLAELRKRVDNEQSNNDDTGNSSSADTDDIGLWLSHGWLKKWLDIEPKILDEDKVDLRPYVFVARDKRIKLDDLAGQGMDGLADSLCGSTMQVRAEESTVKALSLANATTIFNKLGERVLAAGSFTNTPDGVEGLSIIAKHHPALQIELTNLIGSIDVKELGLWVLKGWNESITTPVAKRELLKVLRQWEDQSENMMLKKTVPTAIQAIEGDQA